MFQYINIKLLKVRDILRLNSLEKQKYFEKKKIKYLYFYEESQNFNL